MIGLRVIDPLYVFIDRRYPNGRNTEFDQVIQFIDDTIECTTMNFVVRGVYRTFVAAKETVRYNEINNIVLVYLPVHSIETAGLMVVVLLP